MINEYFIIIKYIYIFKCNLDSKTLMVNYNLGVKALGLGFRVWTTKLKNNWKKNLNFIFIITIYIDSFFKLKKSISKYVNYVFECFLLRNWHWNVVM